MRISIISLAAIAALTACGGGGSPPISPIHTAAPSSAPSSAPAAKNVVAFSLGNAKAAGAKRRAAATTGCSTFSKLTLPAQAFSTYAPTPGTGFAYINEGLEATEYDPNCNVVSTAATFTSTASVTQTTPAFLAQIGPQSQPTFWGTTPGTGTITATFPDGTTGTLPTATYATTVLSCDPYYFGATFQSVSSGGSPDFEDIYSAQSRTDYCDIPDGLASPTTLADGSTFTGDGIVFPYGYEVASTDIFSIADIATVGTFTPAGYALTFQQIAAMNLQLLIVKTASGAYEKVGIIEGNCNSSPAFPRCSAAGYLIAIVSPPSDSTGTFPY